MKLKLIDHRSVTYETTYGTCELCMYTGQSTDTTLFFRWEDGTEFEADAFMWDWGDKYEVYIENLAEFALWVKEQDFDKEETMQEVTLYSGYSWLSKLADDYKFGDEDD